LPSPRASVPTVRGSKTRGSSFLPYLSVTQSPFPAPSAMVCSIGPTYLWDQSGRCRPGNHDYLGPVVRHRVSWPRSIANPRKSAHKERFEEMNTRSWLRKIAIATSLAGLAIGFLLLGLLILIPSNQNNEDAPIASGVVGILLGTAFLMLACSYWRHEALKLRRGGVERFIKQPNVAPPIGSIGPSPGPPQRREPAIAMPADLDSQFENS
jgi:hypothetical protein